MSEPQKQVLHDRTHNIKCRLSREARAQKQARRQALLTRLRATVEEAHGIAKTSDSMNHAVHDAKVADYHKALRKYQETLRELRLNGYE